MGTVLVTRQLPGGGIAPLGGHTIIGPNADDRPFTQSELVDRAREVDAIVCLLTDRIDAAVLDAGASGRLKIVANVAVGYDNIDCDRARQLGIVVSNTPGVLDETTADLAFALILGASRLLSEAESDLRNNRWPGWGITQYLGHDVHGATLGIVGYGRIGQAVARRAAGFSMSVIHHARQPTGLPGYRAHLDALLAESDIVTLHVPGGADSRHLIDARRLALMKRTAVLVNTARGTVVDEAALADALHDGRIFAAGIDVYEREPEIHPRLLSAPHTVLLPHVGSGSVTTRRNMALLAAGAVRAVLAGEVPPNLVVAPG